jgi:DNA-binding NarL/FixJ family response regulator
LLDRSGEFIVAGEAETATEAIQVCAQTHPDLVHMDIGLAGIEWHRSHDRVAADLPIRESHYPFDVR